MKTTMPRRKPVTIVAASLTHQPSLREQFTDAAWRLCQVALWPEMEMDITTINNSHQFINHYLYLHGNTQASFKSFCTRIILAKEYYQQFSGQLPAPGDWLTADHDQGFVMTLTWYKDLLFRRQHADTFREDIEMFVCAYLQYTLTSSPKLMHHFEQTRYSPSYQSLIDLLHLSLNPL